MDAKAKLHLQPCTQEYDKMPTDWWQELLLAESAGCTH